MGKPLALKNVKKTKAKPKVKKWAKKMRPSINKKKQKSHEKLNVNKWARTFNKHLQQNLAIQKDNYFFGDDEVREKITKIMFF